MEIFQNCSARIAALPPEVQFLLCCSRYTMDTARLERAAQLIAEGLDWNEVLARAAHHRVFPLLHPSLKELPGETIPGAVREALAADSERNRQRMEEVTGELLGLVERFEAASIPMLPMKGPVLAARLYGDVALRPAGDLDLLVRKSDIPAALELFRQCGYSARFGGKPPSAGQRDAVCRFLYDFNLVDEERGFSVELHFSLSPGKFPYRVTPDELIRGASSCLIGGRTVPIFNDEENLIYLCVHASKHGWSLLEWVVSVAELVERMEDLDEDRLWNLAVERGAEQMLLLGLALATEVHELECVPKLTRQAGEDPVVDGLVADAIRQLARPDVDPDAESRFQQALCRSLSEKVRWTLCSKFQPERADIKFVDLPLGMLYYFVKPVRMARKRVAQLARGKRGLFTNFNLPMGKDL